MSQKPTKKSHLKIALAHDYLREYGGAERVLEALHELYPDAPVFTAFVDKNGLDKHWYRFADWDIRQSWLTKIPFYKKLYSPLRIVASKCFESFDLSEYDVVISSSNAYFAKAVKVPNGTHICYCHTPPRSLYGYNAVSDWKNNPFTRLAGTVLNHFVRIIDFYVSQRVDIFVANSQETKRRIEKFYRKNSQVIYPPVNMVDQLQKEKNTHKDDQLTQEYFLYVNRLALAKHPEIAVQTCIKLGLPLKVVGAGPMLDKLKEMAIGHQHIEFLGAVSDAELQDLYKRANALLYPVEDEDFGIVPIEAMAHGTPVVAHASGGPLETVIDFRMAHSRKLPGTGVLFPELTTSSLAEGIALTMSYDFDQDKIKEYTQRFSEKRFKEEIVALVESHHKK